MVNWEQFEDDVHIYTSKQVSNRIPLLHVDKSKIFLRSDIFEILSLSSIEWLIKYCRRILKMNRLREIIFVLTFLSIASCLSCLLISLRHNSPLILLLIFAASLPIATFLGGKIFELFLKNQFLAITMTPEDIVAASEAMQSLQSYPYLQRYRFSRHLFLIAGNRLTAKWLTEAKTKSLEQKSE